MVAKHLFGIYKTILGILLMLVLLLICLLYMCEIECVYTHIRVFVLILMLAAASCHHLIGSANLVSL